MFTRCITSYIITTQMPSIASLPHTTFCHTSSDVFATLNINKVQNYLLVMMSSTQRSVSSIASLPIFVKLCIDLSTLSSMMPSTEVTHSP